VRARGRCGDVGGRVWNGSGGSIIASKGSTCATETRGLGGLLLVTAWSRSVPAVVSLGGANDAWLTYCRARFKMLLIWSRGFDWLGFWTARPDFSPPAKKSWFSSSGLSSSSSSSWACPCPPPDDCRSLSVRAPATPLWVGCPRAAAGCDAEDDAAGAGEGTYAPARVRPALVPWGGTGFESVFESSPAMSTSGSEVASCCPADSSKKRDAARVRSPLEAFK
jgi:hypothetical protein